MESRLTSTEVARRLDDILAEVKHAGTTIVVMKNGEPVAQLKPLESGPSCTVSQLAQLWGSEETDPDDAFARDLDRVNQSDLPVANPWE